MDSKKTAANSENFFINHIPLCNTSHVTGLLTHRYVSLGYRISFNPQWVSANKGFQQADTFKSVKVSSKYAALALGWGVVGRLPKVTLCLIVFTDD